MLDRLREQLGPVSTRISAPTGRERLPATLSLRALEAKRG
jgi:hypothetical protein